jgi:hypothetical protein
MKAAKKILPHSETHSAQVDHVMPTNLWKFGASTTPKQIHSATQTTTIGSD